MPILSVLVVLVVLGLGLYLIETYVPLAPPFPLLLRVTAVLFLVVWLLQTFGVMAPMIRIR